MTGTAQTVPPGPGARDVAVEIAPCAVAVRHHLPSRPATRGARRARQAKSADETVRTHSVPDAGAAIERLVVGWERAGKKRRAAITRLRLRSCRDDGGFPVEHGAATRDRDAALFDDRFQSDRLLRLMVAHGSAIAEYSLDELMKIQNERVPPLEVRLSPKARGWQQAEAA